MVFSVASSYVSSLYYILLFFSFLGFIATRIGARKGVLGFCLSFLYSIIHVWPRSCLYTSEVDQPVVYTFLLG